MLPVYRLTADVVSLRSYSNILASIRIRSSSSKKRTASSFHNSRNLSENIRVKNRPESEEKLKDSSLDLSPEKEALHENKGTRIIARNKVNDFFTAVKNPFSKDLIMKMKIKHGLRYSTVNILKKLVTSSINTDGFIEKDKFDKALEKDSTVFNKEFIEDIKHLISDGSGKWLY